MAKPILSTQPYINMDEKNYILTYLIIVKGSLVVSNQPCIDINQKIVSYLLTELLTVTIKYRMMTWLNIGTALSAASSENCTVWYG